MQKSLLSLRLNLFISWGFNYSEILEGTSGSLHFTFTERHINFRSGAGSQCIVEMAITVLLCYHFLCVLIF